MDVSEIQHNDGLLDKYEQGEEDGEDEEDKQHVNCSQYDVPHVSLASTSLYFHLKLYSVRGKQQAEKLKNRKMKVEGWRMLPDGLTDRLHW